MIRSAIIAIAAATVLAGCIGGSDPKPAATKPAAKVVDPQAGDCFADAASKLDPADPDFASKVKCTKPHLYEVTGVTRVPARFLEAPGGPKAKVKEELGDVPDNMSFSLFASTACSNHLWHSLGVDAADVRSRGARLSEIGAFPAVSGIAYRHTTMPEPQWGKGKHDLICFVEFEDLPLDKGAVAPAAVSSYNLEPVAEKFLGSHFPEERRQCLVTSDKNGQEPEPCTRTHDAEIIFSYDARLAFGLPFVNEAVRARGRDDEITDRIVNLCRDFLQEVLERPIGRDLFVWGWSADNGYSGWDLPPDVPSESYSYPVECQVWPTDETLVLAPGTVVHRPDRPDLEDRAHRSDA